MGKKERREWLTRITRPCFVLEFHRCDVCADLHVYRRRSSLEDADERTGTIEDNQERTPKVTQAIETFLIGLFFVLDTTIDFILWWKQNKLAVKPTKR